MDSWDENRRELFSEVIFQSAGDLKNSGVSHVSYGYFEPSSDSVIFTELFRHIGFRRMRMLSYAEHYSRDCIY